MNDSQTGQSVNHYAAAASAGKPPPGRQSNLNRDEKGSGAAAEQTGPEIEVSMSSGISRQYGDSSRNNESHALEGSQ